MKNDLQIAGLDAHTLRNYSIRNALHCMIDPMARGGLELEVSDAIAKQSGKRANGLFIPASVLATVAQRGLTVGSPTGGGHTVATNLRADQFIELLRPKSIAASLGAQALNGLVGNVVIPRATSSAAAYWVPENGTITASDQAFDQVPMTPHTVGATTDISRKMLLQSSIGAEGFVVNDLMNTLAQAIDQAAFTGTGGDNQPTGIFNAAGIPIHALSTNGAALTIDDIIDLETAVCGVNGWNDSSRGGYVFNPKVRAALRKLKTTQGEYLLDTNVRPSVPGESILNGYRSVSSNFIPSNLTKGTGADLSAMVFGDFSQLVIGVWGAIDLTVDKFSLSTSGAARIVALMDVDVCIRHPESFIICKDIVTA
jgi:HK97 family phage major capsid protein